MAFGELAIQQERLTTPFLLIEYKNINFWAFSEQLTSSQVRIFAFLSYLPISSYFEDLLPQSNLSS